MGLGIRVRRPLATGHPRLDEPRHPTLRPGLRGTDDLGHRLRVGGLGPGLDQHAAEVRLLGHVVTDGGDDRDQDSARGAPRPVVETGERGLQSVGEPAVPGLVQRPEQRLLALEVHVRRALGDTGLGGDVVDGGGVVAPPREAAQRSAQDVLASGFPRLGRQSGHAYLS